MPASFAIPSPTGAMISIPVRPADHDDKYDALQSDSQRKAYYDNNGYLVMRNLIPSAFCDDAVQDFRKEVKPYPGYIYRQATANPEKHVITQTGYMLNSILNVQSMDSRHFSHFKKSSLDVLTHPALVAALHNLINDTPKLVQSMYFEGNPSTWAHQDAYYLDSEEQGRMVAIWVALEDIQPGAGRFYVYPGSHKIDVQKNGGGIDIAFHHDKYKAHIIKLIDDYKLECIAPALRKGDVLFWHGKTIHGSLQTTQPEYSRNSFTGHYIPASTRYLQYQSNIKKLNLEEVNGIPVNFPKNLDKPLSRFIFGIETTFPQTFRTLKKIAIKMMTK